MVERLEQPLLDDLQEDVDPGHLAGDGDGTGVGQRAQDGHAEGLVQGGQTEFYTGSFSFLWCLK